LSAGLVNMVYKTRLIIYAVVALIFLSVLFFITRIPTGDGLYSLIDSSGKISKPVFLEITVKFADIKGFINLLDNDSDSLIQQIMPDLFIVNYGKTSWVCDRRMSKAYSLYPSVDMFGRKYCVRMLPADNSSIDISSLNGTYICDSFISDDFTEHGIFRVADIYITSCRKINTWLKKPVNRIIGKTFVYPQPDKWIGFVKSQYPHREMPQNQPGALLCYSYPNGLRVYHAKKGEIAKCMKDGKIDKHLLNARIANSNHLVGETPIYLPDHLRKFEFYLIYEFISPNSEILHDGESFEVIDQLPGNLYRILRGYYMDFTIKNKSPNYSSIALFQLNGLKVADFFDLIPSEKRFTVDAGLFDLFITPVLRQAFKEGVDHAYTPKTCKEILERAGKLNIQTHTGNYIFSICLKKDSRYSLLTYGRCTSVIMRDSEVLKKLPGLIYRQKGNK